MLMNCEDCEERMLIDDRIPIQIDYDDCNYLKIAFECPFCKCDYSIELRHFDFECKNNGDGAGYWDSCEYCGENYVDCTCDNRAKEEE